MPDLSRAAALEESLAERGLDALLVTDLVDLRYLTGFTGSAGLAVVGRDIRAFVTDFRYLSQSEAQLDPGWHREITQDGLQAALAALGAPEALALGYDDTKVTVRQHARLEELAPAGVRLEAAGGMVEALRLVKDADEVEALRAAAALADEALEEVLGRGLAGRTERDVALDLEFTMRRKGASEASFPSIIASGAHGALPHAVPRDVVIPEGVLVTIDWGAVLDGYASDCTRTYATGELDPRDREVFDLVLRAQLAALEAVRPGPTGREVDAVAREIITAAGHGEHFGHGLGHGVGLEVHEGPRLSQKGEVALAAGHAVTVEPGVYVPGACGVRIEDLAIVTEDGHEVLTHLPKELQVIPAAS